MNETQDPLKKLIVDVKALDRQRLVELLDGIVIISTEGELSVLPKFSNLSTKNKVLALVLGRRASHALNFSEKDSMTPKELEEASGLPGGTLRPLLMKMASASDRILVNKGGSYHIPNYAIPSISLEELAKNSPSESSRGRSRGSVTKPSQSQNRAKTESLQKLLEIELDKVDPKLQSLMVSPGKYLERALAVLKIGRENQIDYLTPAEITGFLKEKIRPGALTQSNISYALGKDSRYADRIPNHENGGYSYRITARGEKLLGDVLNDAPGKTPK
jgi:hypothetical protein